MTDGPFAETREQLGGYYLVEAKDLDEAIRIAERIPPARFGTIEIRPVMEIRAYRRISFTVDEPTKELIYMEPNALDHD